jgi:tetratricopeptide (TPR) repeat protein
MLVTIRSYATEQLHASSEHDAVRDRHTAHYCNLAVAATPTLSNPAQPEVLDSLQLEHDNLRAALRRLLDLGAVEDFASACSRLWMFWTIRGHLAEGQAWADEALATGGTLPAAARAKLLLVAGWMRYVRGEYDQAAERLAEAAQLARDAADLSTLCWVLPAWASVEGHRGHPHTAAELFEQAATLSRQVGEVRETTFAILATAVIAIARGQLADVDELLNAHAAQLRAQGAPCWLALTLEFHGRVALHLGKHSRADELLREAVLISARLHDLWGIMHQLTGLANTAALRCDPHRAAMLYGAADALIERTGATLLPAWQEPSGRCQAAVIAAIGDDTFQALRHEGQQLPITNVIALATSHRPS